MSDNELGLQEFSRAISHDLGSAIRGVDQLTALLEQDISHKLDDKERYWMQLIRESAERAQGMIEALTVYTRLSSRASKPCTINLTDLITTSVEASVVKYSESDPQANKPKITLELEELTLMGVAEHWVLLIRELIANALEFRPENDTHEIDIKLVRDGGQGCFVIEDNGIGVQSEKIAQMTTPFVSSREREDMQHFGMGLSYCARIAQLNGASLQFANSQSGGLRVSYLFALNALE